MHVGTRTWVTRTYIHHLVGLTRTELISGPVLALRDSRIFRQTGTSLEMAIPPGISWPSTENMASIILIHFMSSVLKCWKAISTLGV